MLNAFVERLPDEGDILVVGAGHGQQASELARLRSGCRIYAIEPDPRRFANLAGAARGFDNISLVQCGFSDEEGQVSFQDWPEGNPPIVAAMPLDAYAGPRRLNVVGVLITAGGAEPAVIAGGMETLRGHRSWVCMDFAPQVIAQFGRDPTVFGEYLLSNFDVVIGRDSLVQRTTGGVLMRSNGARQVNH